MFVPATAIPFVYLERPYYIVPINKGAKVYALLREALLNTRRVGVARVVIQTKQHLAVLVPSGPALVLNLLRWADEIRSWENLSFPAEGTEEAGITEKELKMAEQLVTDMSGKWKPEQFHDSFKDEIMKLVNRKAESGDIQSVVQPEEVESPRGAQILDLTELLQRSLKSREGEGNQKKASSKSAAKPVSDDATSTGSSRLSSHKRRA